MTWASPNERTPGVSITHPPARSGSAIADVEVCRPLPTPVTLPVARLASGTSAFTSVDLPTPECPIITDTDRSSRSRTASIPSTTRGPSAAIAAPGDQDR